MTTNSKDNLTNDLPKLPENVATHTVEVTDEELRLLTRLRREHFSSAPDEEATQRIEEFIGESSRQAGIHAARIGYTMGRLSVLQA